MIKRYSEELGSPALQTGFLPLTPPKSFINNLIKFLFFRLYMVDIIYRIHRASQVMLVERTHFPKQET